MKNLTLGWKSTSFWVTNLFIIGTFALTLEKTLPPRFAAYAVVASAVCYIMSRGIKKLADLEVAKGWKTSEFAVGVLTLIVGVLSTVKGILPPSEAALCGSLIAGAFSLSQGLAQFGTTPGALPPVVLETGDSQ